jgi:enoyl-[acyl-carrier protein] reductase / trans-2-enoyl-CoA reductase (NAD+)
MTLRVITPRGKGALLLDSHPVGCARSVAAAAAEVADLRSGGTPPVALIIGSSSGYGHALAVAGLAGLGISGVGLALERPADARRTASAGWYRTEALAGLAREHGCDFEFVNGDCFAAETKAAVLDRFASRYGRIDYLIYSVAAPRRSDVDGVTYQSAIRPRGAAHTTYAIDFDTDPPALKPVTVGPAADHEIEATVKVMGGEDWADWVSAAAGRDLLAPGFQTVALSYVGSAMTAPIYRDGTIGAAKDHLESTAGTLPGAFTSVNGAVVTQASTAIPGIGLYVSLLHEVLGDGMESPVTQGVRLWKHLTGVEAAGVDETGRVRLDDWEFAPGVQDRVARLWQSAVDAGQLPATAGAWFQSEVRRLYGFDVDGVDYSVPVEVGVPG